eukprot:scaffold125625_cov45-Phaeocystis_antarctica.AAC.2
MRSALGLRVMRCPLQRSVEPLAGAASQRGGGRWGRTHLGCRTDITRTMYDEMPPDWVMMHDECDARTFACDVVMCGLGEDWECV